MYWGDYLADTGHLKPREHGAYVLLIAHYWMNGSLPTDDEVLRRITRLTAREWSRSKVVLRSLFGDNWSHKRIDKELAKAIEKSRVNSANAKRSHSGRKPNVPISQTQPQPESQEEKIKRADARGDENVSRDTLPVESPAEQPSKYVFEGAIVRLTQKHFDEWQRAFSSLDLRAELMARDAWLERASEADRNNWFISTSKYLANRNMEARSKQSTFKWRSGIEGVI